MKTNTVYLLAVVVFLLLASSKVFACSCVPPKYGETLETKVGKARNNSEAVFTGTVLNIVEDEENHTRTVRLRLLKSWKGNFSRVVTIVTGWDDGDCGYLFTTGGTYLVYAFTSDSYTTKRQLTTNICTRTAVAYEARKDIAILNRRKKSR